MEPTESAREQVTQVVGSLVRLLSVFQQPGPATWLSERLPVLQDPEAASEKLADVFRELHGIVLGMGGLTDLHLRGGSKEATDEANTELRHLADQLYELTR